MRTLPSLVLVVVGLALALSAAACGDDLVPDPAGPTAPVGRTLTGSQIVEYRALDGALLGESPIDLWDTVVEAHVPDGDGWIVRPGSGHRDGSFEIDGLPDGHVWLRVARRPFGEAFYWTDADHVSFDEAVLGPELPTSAADGDQLALEVDGLAPWQDGDELAWFVPEDIVFDMNLVAAAPPTAETTDLAGTAIDWTGRSLARVAAGEPAYLVQYRTQTFGAGDGVALRAPLRAAQPTIAQEAGVDGTLAATLEAPATLDYHLTFARDVFEAERTTAHPTRAGASIGRGFSLTALPGIVDGDLWLAIEYPLANLADPAVLDGATTLELGTLAIPNPFPREWLIDLFVVTFPVELPLPDGTPATLEAVLGRRSTALAGASAPLVTAIRAPRIAGGDAFTALGGVGTTPEVSWTAPATGTATSYKLSIIEGITAPPEPFRPGWYVVAELVVPGDVTSIRLPADVLREGSTYGIVVRTFAQDGHDARRQPFVQRATAGFADAILGPFSP